MSVNEFVQSDVILLSCAYFSANLHKTIFAEKVKQWSLQFSLIFLNTFAWFKYSWSKTHRSPCYIFHKTFLLFIKTNNLHLQISIQVTKNLEKSQLGTLSFLQEILIWYLILMSYIKAVGLVVTLRHTWSRWV